jgi:hypothetical protein
VAVAAGDAIEYLQYRAEGSRFVRINGEAVEAGECPAQDKRSFKLEAMPTIEWWIRTILDDQYVGWLLVDDRVVKLVRRRF